MKKLSLVLLLSVAALVTDVYSHTLVYGRPFLRNRTPYDVASPERVAFFRPQLRVADECNHSLQVVPLGGQFFQREDNIAGFFSANSNPVLRIVETKNLTQLDGLSDEDNASYKDVDASHFNIKTSGTTAFRSLICFNPKQTFGGVGATYQYTIKRDECGNTKWWLEASTALLTVSNNLGFQEKILDDGGGAAEGIGLSNSPFVGSVTHAFQQPAFKYGKMTPCSLKKTGLTEIEFKIGRNGTLTECFRQGTYLGVSIPTGNKPEGRYVFEPIVGDLGFFAILWGSTLKYDMFKCGDHGIQMALDINTRFMFSNNQIRSFDLKGKPWSRYMQMYASSAAAQQAAADSDANAGTFGTNIMTRCVSVDPGFAMTVNTGFIYNCRCWQLEGGFNFYGRQAETLCLKGKWNNQPALRALSGDGNTTTARTIKNNYEASIADVDDYQAITRGDLDLDSAAMPATLNNTVYLAAGCNWEECSTPLFFSIGGSVDLTKINTSMDRWTMWGKFGIRF